MSETAASSTRRFRWSAQAGVVATWALLIVIGTALLRMPLSATGPSLTWLDAAFTSTSAVCVTGLTTIDIGDRLSFSGQVILLVLIQLGGLGIGTVSTFLLLSAGRAGVADHLESAESLAALRGRPFRLVRWAVVITLAFEIIGALLLAWRLPGPDAWWRGLFHSVSAFCNAGFSLWPGSLEPHAQDPIIMGALAGLIVFGGLGFIVHLQLNDWLVGRMRGRPKVLPLHSRVVIYGNIVLWTAGTLVYVSLESGGVLQPLSLGDRWQTALFQSITLRTAGFSTIDFGGLREATLLFCLLFMFIGAAPGSCGGGIKVTTAAVLAAVAVARMRGADAITLLRRTLPPEIMMRTFALMTLSLLFLAAMSVSLLITDGGGLPADPGYGKFTSAAFETVSAFGTVGLSTGWTPELSAAGKLLIMLTMFVGRLGPLVVALAVVGRARRSLYQYPTEPIAIG